MKRRTVLATVGTGWCSLAGCLRGDQGTSDPDLEIIADVGGYIDTIAEDTLFLNEDFERGDGRLIALDIDSDEIKWRFGGTDDHRSYTSVTVDDGIYFGMQSGQIVGGNGELYALEFDGSERWRDTSLGSVHQTAYTDGVVYARSTPGVEQVVQAFDATDGEELWITETPGDPEVEEPDEPAVSRYLITVTDLVYILQDEELMALDRSNGEIRWRYGDPAASIGPLEVHDEVVYVIEENTIAAVSGDDGTELWTQVVDRGLPSVHSSVGTDRLFVLTLSDDTDGNRGRNYYTFDLKTGDKLWETRFDGSGSMKHIEDRVYDTGEGLLRALDATDGSKLWTADISGRVQSIEITETGSTEELLIKDSGDHLHKVTTDGEVTGSKSIPELRSLAVNGSAYVSDRDRVYRLDLDSWNQED